jgi:hypothetical protein
MAATVAYFWCMLPWPEVGLPWLALLLHSGSKDIGMLPSPSKAYAVQWAAACSDVHLKGAMSRGA